MRRYMYFAAAALLGAGSYLTYHQLTGPPDPPPAAENLTGMLLDSETVSPSPAPGPILTVDEPLEVEGKQVSLDPPSGTGAPGSPDPGPGDETPAGSETGKVVSEPVGPPGEGEFGSLVQVSLKDLQNTIRLSQAAFTAGDTTRGVKLLREIFRQGKDLREVNLVPQVRKLLDLEEDLARGQPVGLPEDAIDPLDLCRYIEERDSDPKWRFRASLALGSADSKERTPEAMRSAWKRLTQAYLAASSSVERDQVKAVLNPFLERHIFSKRYSPLVETYTVKEGDSLYTIAKERGTTPEGLQRLNRIKGTVIHPGQRLIYLSGKPKIFVKKSEFRLWFLVGDRLLLEYPVGLGQYNSTPASTFVIKDRQKDPIWYRRGEAPIPAGDPRNILGSRWLGFKETEEFEGFGIHGTADPSSIGKEASAGCIRMLNENLEILWDLVPLGTEVEISE